MKSVQASLDIYTVPGQSDAMMQIKLLIKFGKRTADFLFKVLHDYLSITVADNQSPLLLLGPNGS